MHDLQTSDVITGLMGVIATYMAWVLQKMGSNLESLNEKMAAILVRVDTKEKAIDDHEERIRDVEREIASLDRKGCIQ